MQGIHTIFTHTTDKGTTGDLGIDDEGNLYWNKLNVKTQNKISQNGG